MVACIAPAGPAPALCQGALSGKVDGPALIKGHDIHETDKHLRLARAREALEKNLLFADLRRQNRSTPGSVLAISTALCRNR